MNCKHSGDKVEDSFSKKLDDILGITHTNCPYVKPCPVESQSKRAIIQAILDELPEKKSVKERLKYHRDIGLEVDIESANSYNQAIDELRQRLTK